MNNQDQVLLGIYAIYDLKSEQYDTPFFSVSDIYAKRRFLLMSDEEKSALNKWPEDFELHKVASFGTSSGNVTDKIDLIYKGVKRS